MLELSRRRDLNFALMYLLPDKVDLMLRRLLGPDLLSMLCVVAVSAVSIVGVWKVSKTYLKLVYFSHGRC